MRAPCKSTTRCKTYLVCAAAVCLLNSVHATESALISDGTASQARGHVAVNEAAGTGNAQLNQTVLAPGAHAGVVFSQHVGRATSAGAMTAIVGAGAFAGAQGAIAINQASGASNRQFNVTLFGAQTQIETVADRRLAAAAPHPAPELTANPADSTKVVAIDSGAFRGAAGVVQINQSVGTGNSTGNAFTLQIPGSSFPNLRSIP